MLVARWDTLCALCARFSAKKKALHRGIVPNISRRLIELPLCRGAGGALLANIKGKVATPEKLNIGAVFISFLQQQQ
jgi:hypothetical protein